jgi:septal ring factor EnvC (AmiA/AmiB activator)
VERFERDAAAYQAARADARRAGERHQAAATRLRQEQTALEREQVAKQALLERVKEDRKAERELLVELERAARALEATLAELGETGRQHGGWLDGSGFAQLRGKLPLPVEARVIARFGRVVDADFLTQTVRNGVDFGASEGAGVRATARAEVRFAGWFRGYGKIVILDHGDSYFTVSGHLSQIHVAVGDRVGAGETIGNVGDTGSLSGPRLYFELRRGSDALDPVSWLSADRLARAR